MTQTPTVDAEQLLRALDQRLAAAAQHILPGWEDPQAAGAWAGSPDRPERPPGLLAAGLLPQLAAGCPTGRGPTPEVWLLMCAVAAAFPVAQDVEDVARRIDLDGPERTSRHLLDQVLTGPAVGRLDLPMQVVSDRVVVDVDSCARNDSHTGIQRVVRETVPRWQRDHHVLAVSNLDDKSCYRELSPRQHARIYAFGQHRDVLDRVEPSTLVVPWRTTVLWPEVPHPEGCLRLSALAQYSGSLVGLIGYDMIPIVTTELRPFGESGIFQRYLSAVKYSHRVAGISVSAATEFTGFADMVASEGIPGPAVAEVELVEDVGTHDAAPAEATGGDRPVVMFPGRRVPHKNLRACLQAAERLWLRGLDFEVVMFEGDDDDLDGVSETIERLRRDRRPITTLGYVTDDEMWSRLRSAAFVVFPSLHEGYGLPITEALACGTPVITSDFGSQREIAARGGCLVVDPRDDQAIARAMDLLLTEPGRLEALRAQIADRPRRTWDEYAVLLWRFLVEGETP